jgi:hypothetical protein
MMECGFTFQTWARAMIFYSRWGYLVVVFFVVAAFIAGGVSTAYHLSLESTSVLLFLFWGPLCVGFGRKLGTPEKPSTLFWIPMEYWGYALIGLGALSAYRMGQDSERLARGGVGDCCFRKPVRRICIMSIHVKFRRKLAFSVSWHRAASHFQRARHVSLDIEIADDLSAWAHERGERAAATC